MTKQQLREAIIAEDHKAIKEGVQNRRWEYYGDVWNDRVTKKRLATIHAVQLKTNNKVRQELRSCR